MSKISKYRRHEIICQLLRGRDQDTGLSAMEIHQRMESQGIDIDLRSIRRDLEELSSAHGLSSSETRPERFFISKDFSFQHELRLNDKTLQALFIALGHLRSTSHDYFADITTEAENTILASLSEEVADSWRESKESYLFDYSKSGRPAGNNLKDFELVLEAIRTHKIINCKNESPYRDEDYNQRKRSFAPHALMLASGIPYLVAMDVEDSKYKKLRLTRVSEVEVTNTSFTPANPKEHMDFSAFYGGWSGDEEGAIDIKVTCDKIMANYFKERSVHPSQTIRKLSNNKYQVCFHCAGSSELARLIASFGGSVKAVEPLSLYREIKEIWISGIKNAG